MNRWIGFDHFSTFHIGDVSYLIFTDSLKNGPFDLLTINLVRNTRSLKYMLMPKRVALKAKLDFLLCNYNVAYDTMVYFVFNS